MNEEKVLTLRGKRAVWAAAAPAPSTPKRLPEGYPYKESNQTVIEWDGNVGDLETAGELVRVSEQIFSVEELNGATATMSDGTTVVINDAHDSAEQIIALLQGNVPLIVVVPEDIGDSVKKGTYFLQDNPFCSKLAIGTETIHTMAPEFLPAGVGGNNREFIIDVGDGFSSATTYADVLAAIKAGKCPIVYWNAGGSLLKSYGYMVSEADGAVGFVFFHAGSQIGIAVTESGWGAQ